MFIDFSGNPKFPIRIPKNGSGSDQNTRIRNPAHYIYIAAMSYLNANSNRDLDSLCDNLYLVR